MSVNAVKVTTQDLLEIQEAIERKASITEVVDLLKKARLYHNSEKSLQLPVAQIMERILHQYVVYPE